MYPVLSCMAMYIISVKASSVASESAFSISGRVLSIRKTRLTPASLEMCMCLKDHLDAKDRKQDKSPLEIPLDFEEDVLDDEEKRNEAIPLSDEEIALDASSEGTLSLGGPRFIHEWLQETKTGDVNHLLIQSLWHNTPFDYVAKKSDGRSGGIIAVWDTTSFSLLSSMDGDGFIAILGKWINIDSPCLMIVVYAPQDQRRKEKLWYDLTTMISDHNSLSIVLGNFNEINPLTTHDIEYRTLLVNELMALEHHNLKDLRQKAKNHIFNSFESKFKEPNTSRPAFASNLFKHLSCDEVQLLDQPFTSLEIKEVVWDCGGDKSPGPDGFTFKLIKKYWDSMSQDIILDVKHFDSFAFIPKGCNLSLITLIPKTDDPLVIGDFRPISIIGCHYKIIAKILANRHALVIPSIVGEVQMAFIKGCQIIDGPLMVDEIISWAKRKKKKLMFLKVDFEKAFDTLNWSFLMSVMEQMGFTSKWRNWIFSCLDSAYASILVNGSPTSEFKVQRGLRQGDPLSPFLFILAVEALNVALLEATNNNFFHGVKVGILNCFHLSSGLKVNFNKSKLYGIGVNNIENKLTSSKSNGGLGIGSLKSSNQAMLAKWWWRFHNEGNALWCKLIRSIHGQNIGNGSDTRFWTDNWVGGGLLKFSFPRLYRLDTNHHWPDLAELEDLCSLVAHLRLSLNQDIWECTIDDSRTFTVKGMRSHITHLSTNTSFIPIRWNSILPYKVNILTCRIVNLRLPTRVNLDYRGIDLDSIRCPICDAAIETENHLFTECDLSKSTWNRVLEWWGIQNINITNINDIMSLAYRVHLPASTVKIFDSVVQTTMWVLWRFRNEATFAIKRPNKDLIINDIMSLSFNCILLEENAANVIGLLGCDLESVEHMIDVGVCSVFDMLLKEGPIKVQKVVAWADSELVKHYPKCQNLYAQHSIVRSVTKEDKDEQGKEEKGVVNIIEVVLYEQTLCRVLNEVCGIVLCQGIKQRADL
ncbi:RNA-directed DNA polymerase, eukaryota [Tanacetum coccineum]